MLQGDPDCLPAIAGTPRSEGRQEYACMQGVEAARGSTLQMFSIQLRVHFLSRLRSQMLDAAPNSSSMIQEDSLQQVMATLMPEEQKQIEQVGATSGLAMLSMLLRGALSTGYKPDTFYACS